MLFHDVPDIRTRVIRAAALTESVRIFAVAIVEYRRHLPPTLLLKFTGNHSAPKNLFHLYLTYLVTCLLVVSFVTHYKLERRNEYTGLVYGVENSEEWPEWIGKESGGRIGIPSVKGTGTPLFR